MKDLFHYFKSPVKNLPINESARFESTTPENSLEDTKTLPKNVHSSKLQSDQSEEINGGNNLEKKKQKRRGGKSKKLSLNLNEGGLSPLQDELPLAQNATQNEIDTNIYKANSSEKAASDLVLLTSEEDMPTPKQKNAVNAFQFLMDSRNKVLGSNLDGKETTYLDEPSMSEKKFKLSSRKNLLKSWSEEKSLRKRKITDEEIDKVIKVKLKKRAKRLKTMLNIDKQNSDNDFLIEKPSTSRKQRKSKKRKRIVVTDSDSDKDFSKLDGEINTQSSSKSTFQKPDEIEENLVCSVVLGKNDKCIENLNFSDIVNQNTQKKQILLDIFGVVSLQKANLKEKSCELLQIDESDFDSHNKNICGDEDKVLSKDKKGKRNLKKSKKSKFNCSDLNVEHEIKKVSQLTSKINSEKDRPVDVNYQNINMKNLEKSEEKYIKANADLVSREIENGYKKKEQHGRKRKTKKTKFDLSLTSLTPKSRKSWTMKIKITDTDEENFSDTPKTGSKILEKLEEDPICLSDNKSSQFSSDKNVLTEILLNAENIEEIGSENEDTVVETEEIANQSNGNRRVLRERHPKKVLTDSDQSSDDCIEVVEKKSKTKKNSKLAPVFLKATPKPKVDPEIAEARRKFLMSGIPDIMKKAIEKQESISLPEFEVFPEVSHIQQITDEDQKYFNTSKIDLRLSESTTSSSRTDFQQYEFLTNKNVSTVEKFKTKRQKIKNVKSVIKTIKMENPKYPVNRCFRILSSKRVLNSEPLVPVVDETPVRKRGRPKNKSTQEVIKETSVCTVDTATSISTKNLMWIEKYKPETSDEILGNLKSVKTLKEWLQNWNEVAKESGLSRKRKATRSSDSESDFISTDGESRDSMAVTNTTIILTGPCGSGKTSAVYAVCNELELNVLEINASERRTGKRLIQELQEATQSHQVRKGDTKLSNFYKFEKSVIPSDQQNKMCVLLVEDVDIVFEQDDGFISALSQIAVSSKRPILLTTSDPNSIYVEKFNKMCKTINFFSLSAKTLSLWIQILCLIEGYHVNLSCIAELLLYNKGDIRKTLLEMQYWINSGGQIDRKKQLTTNIFEMDSICEDLLPSETSSNQVDEHNLKINIKESKIHTNCIGSFEMFQNFNFPLRYDLDIIWWNLSKIFPSNSEDRLNKITLRKNEENVSKNDKTEIESCDNSRLASLDERKQLNEMSKLYDSLTLTDVSYKKHGYRVESDIFRNFWCEKTKDSLQLNERMENYSEELEVAFDWTHFLSEGHFRQFRKNEGLEQTGERWLNMAVPSNAEKCWRFKTHQYQKNLGEAVPYFSLDRKSFALDYIPTLRNIARTERVRSLNNMKRYNRFHHYLSNFDVKCTDNMLNIACNMLR